MGFFYGVNMSLIARLHQADMPPLIMGVLNVTPDSFSDGGRYLKSDQLKYRIEQIAEQGAQIIDIGGESTRPGAAVVSVEEELERVMPALEITRQLTDCWVSVDTYKTPVMQAALELGLDLINDVNALQTPGALEAVADSSALICLMHKKGQPLTMQQAPRYDDVVAEVLSFLQARAQVCLQHGIAFERIVLDPGFGFGKSLIHNIALFQQLESLVALKYPVLVGVSRKTMIGQLLQDASVDQRMIGSVAAAVVAALKGAKILRVHDVLETQQALELAWTLK